MKKLCFALLLLCATVGYAMPIASSARVMVPSELQQLIGVDYRALKDSPTAQALKDKVMPQNLKDLEIALKALASVPIAILTSSISPRSAPRKKAFKPSEWRLVRSPPKPCSRR